MHAFNDFYARQQNASRVLVIV